MLDFHSDLIYWELKWEINMKSAIVLLLNVDGLGMFENYLSLLNAKTQMEQVNSEFAFGLDENDRAEQDRHYLKKNPSYAFGQNGPKVRF